MSILKIAVSSDDHQLGSDRAPVTLVEYGDYQCSYCAAAEPVVRYVRERFGRDLRFVFRNFPLREVHAYAERAAQVAEFAGAHGKFWQMHDLLFEHQGRFSPSLFGKLAERLDLSRFYLREALALGLHRARVLEDLEGGVRSGVNGTPTFFINSLRWDGPADGEGLATEIQQILSRAAPQRLRADPA